VIDFDFSWGKEKSRQTFCVALGQVKMNFPLTIPSTFQQRKRKPKKEADSEGKSLIKTNDWQLVFTVIGAPHLPGTSALVRTYGRGPLSSGTM